MLSVSVVMCALAAVYARRSIVGAVVVVAHADGVRSISRSAIDSSAYRFLLCLFLEITRVFLLYEENVLCVCVLSEDIAGLV